MLSRKAAGFSLAEMLVSVAVIGLLAVIVIANLNSSKKTEELRNAARGLAADMRGMQARALAAGDVSACPDNMSKLTVCENSTALCQNPAQCQGHVPSFFGIYVSSTDTGYNLFAEVEPTTADNKFNPNELLAYRQLLPAANPDVEIQKIMTGSPAPLIDHIKGNISFTRQSGITRLEDGSGNEPSVMVIRLRQKLSGDTLDVEINRVTGRVSILKSL